jgi:phosphoribosyl-ATP pyrophosphohydrolase
MTSFIGFGAPGVLRGSILIEAPNLSRFADTLDRLAATIEARKGADPSSSYTAKLLSEGVERLAKKFGEEAVETVIAAVAGDPDALAAESADVIYHWLALLAGSGVNLDAVAAKLEAREGTSGLAEKASRAE